MKSKPTISLCMIVKDEQSFLGECLKSISRLVDEIIIVDTGSKDDTIKIAESFGAKVIEHKWNNDFSEARNVSLKHATKDWILVLDADEMISKRDFENILALLREESYDALYLIQRNYLIKGILSSADVSSNDDNYPESKDYIGWSPIDTIRIFRNHRGYSFNDVIHESVKLSIKNSGGMIKNTKIPIHHFNENKEESFKQN